MKIKTKRVPERSGLLAFLLKIRQYTYVESLGIIFIYLAVGYLIDPTDMCLFDAKVPFLLILLSVITLFHGFENGLVTLAVIAFVMWFFYPIFQTVSFLVLLMMTLIFSEFHYYWTKKITQSKLDADYRGMKLDELSKAFYTLKISHDQLEKNYVIKPMSIRSSIEQILKYKVKIDRSKSIDAINRDYFKHFLLLLEKSFSVKSGLIIYAKEDFDGAFLSEENVEVTYDSVTEEIDKTELMNDYLVNRALSRKKPIFVSDNEGEPTLRSDRNSKFIAVIPSIIEDRVVALLAIERMPFMSFNRENLTSIAILLDYFSIEIRDKNILDTEDVLESIDDAKFRFEYCRLEQLYKQYKLGTIVLVLKMDHELQALRVYEKVQRMLRSLDMVHLTKQGDFFYIVHMFPFHDKSAALGYLKRLTASIEDEKDRKFSSMTFDMKQRTLLEKYLKEEVDV